MSVATRALFLVALPFAAALSAGCLGASSGACRDGYPLAVQAHPVPTDPAVHRVQVFLWDCDSRTLAYDETCLPGFALFPRLEHENVTYVVGANLSALPFDELPCETRETRRIVVQDGTTVSGQLLWGLTILRPGADAPERLPPGVYWLRVDVAGISEAARAEVAA